MKRKRTSLAILVIAVMGLLFLASCGEESVVGPEPQTQLEQRFTTEQVSWIPWKAEYLDKVLTEEEKHDIQNQLSSAGRENVRSLEKMLFLFPGTECRELNRQTGGTVGGRWTFGNQVEVPSYAFPENRRIVGVWAAYMFGLPGVEFFPDQQFDTDVRVTLSFDCLDFSGDPGTLNVYWLDETTGEWVLVPNPEIDMQNRTVSVYVNHFTRYQWGL